MKDVNNAGVIPKYGTSLRSNYLLLMINRMKDEEVEEDDEDDKIESAVRGNNMRWKGNNTSFNIIIERRQRYYSII